MLKVQEGPIWKISVKDFVIAMKPVWRTRSQSPLCGVSFQTAKAASNWIGDVEGKTSSEIVRWVERMAGTAIRNDN